MEIFQLLLNKKGLPFLKIGGPFFAFVF